MSLPHCGGGGRGAPRKHLHLSTQPFSWKRGILVHPGEDTHGQGSALPHLLSAVSWVLLVCLYPMRLAVEMDSLLPRN